MVVDLSLLPPLERLAQPPKPFGRAGVEPAQLLAPSQAAYLQALRPSLFFFSSFTTLRSTAAIAESQE